MLRKKTMWLRWRSNVPIMNLLEIKTKSKLLFYHKKDISNVTIVKTSYFYFQVYCMHKLWPITSFLYVENTKYINKGKISTCKTYHFLLRCKQINNRNILQLLDHGVHLNYFHGIDVFLKGVIHSQKEYINHINHVFYE